MGKLAKGHQYRKPIFQTDLYRPYLPVRLAFETICIHLTAVCTYENGTQNDQSARSLNNQHHVKHVPKQHGCVGL